MENPLATIPDGPTPRPGRLWKRILKWVTFCGLVLTLLLVLAGFTYNAIAQHADALRFPQQGKSVQLGHEFNNLTMNLDCSGQGSPTVILESGAGVPALGWKYVQTKAAQFAHVCSYDRAGYGWSTAGPMPRTSSEMARELHALLAAAGEKPPYVMVGHSLGGFNIRVFNSAYPGEVAGMVLVDGSSEDGGRAQGSKRSPAFATFLKKQEQSMKWQRRLAPALIYLGVKRLMPDPPPAYLSIEDQEEFRYFELQPKFYAAAMSEIDSFSVSADEVRAAGKLGDKPLVVLTAAKPVTAPPGLLQKDFDDIQNRWVNDLQVRETHLSTRGRQIILPGSSHMIPFERPDIVVSAINEVWAATNAPER
jgi:pimeloyl-ACP methyl ester carboxylesterase